MHKLFRIRCEAEVIDDVKDESLAEKYRLKLNSLSDRSDRFIKRFLQGFVDVSFAEPCANIEDVLEQNATRVWGTLR